MILCDTCLRKNTCTEICNEEIDINIKQPEETMNDKIPQMTEKRAREMAKKLVSDNATSVEAIVMSLKANNYIIKPEIEQKIEEAENIHQIYQKKGSIHFDSVIDKLYNLIQLLKPYYYNSKEWNE